MKRPEMDPDIRGAHPEIGIRIYIPADPEFGVSLVPGQVAGGSELMVAHVHGK